MTLTAVWGSSADDVYAVGDDGVILHSADRGTTWQRLALEDSSDRDLKAVFGTGPDHVYIVGGDGRIFHGPGTP